MRIELISYLHSCNMRLHAKRLFCVVSLFSLTLLLLYSLTSQKEPVHTSKRSEELTLPSTSRITHGRPWLPLQDLHLALNKPSPSQQHSYPALPSLPIQPGDGGYLFALAFNEQLESGMFDLHQLADLSTSWKLRLVEPYILNTQFRFPSLPHSGRLLKLSDVYDLQDLNGNLQKSLNVSHEVIVPLGQVAKQASRGFHLVILQLVPYSLSRHGCAQTNVTKYTHKLTSHLGCKEHQCVQKTSVACLNTKMMTNFRKLFDTHPVLKQALQEARHSGKKILVAIPIWNGIRSYRDRFFYWDPAFKNHRYIHSHATAHSKEVKGAALGFLDTLHLDPPTLGIHIRLERLLRERPFNKSAVAECLTVRLHDLVRNLQRSHGIQTSILFRDYSKHGSSTCAGVNCSQFAQQLGLDNRMRALGVHVLEYQPKSRKIRREHGFSANVEQEVLSRTDYLITVGYGSFQQGIISRFKRQKRDQHKDWHEQNKIFEICS